MRSRLLATSAVVVLVLLASGPVGTKTARAQAPTTPPPAPPLPKAWILVDGDSGAVVSGSHDTDLLPAASVIKLLSALITVEHLPPDTLVPVSARAEGMPARKLNLKAGQQWRADDLLRAVLLVSANDAAVALAERLGGGDDGFAGLMTSTARRLGIDDEPVLRDPAGLDDEFSYQGGNLISARDLAIVTRAVLANPELASIVVAPEYRFTGGDGNPHRLLNHNRLLKTYPGAIGMKTGYTRRAGHCLVAAARREGRTMIAVVLHAVDTYGSASALLDQGFATPPGALVERDHLPEVVSAPAPVTADTQPAPEHVSKPVVDTPLAVASPAVRASRSHRLQLALFSLLALPALLVLGRRRQVRRRRELRRRAAVILGAEDPPIAGSSAPRTRLPA